MHVAGVSPTEDSLPQFYILPLCSLPGCVPKKEPCTYLGDLLDMRGEKWVGAGRLVGMGLHVLQLGLLWAAVKELAVKEFISSS